MHRSPRPTLSSTLHPLGRTKCADGALPGNTRTFQRHRHFVAKTLIVAYNVQDYQSSESPPGVRPTSTTRSQKRLKARPCNRWTLLQEKLNLLSVDSSGARMGLALFWMGKALVSPSWREAYIKPSTQHPEERSSIGQESPGMLTSSINGQTTRILRRSKKTQLPLQASAMHPSSPHCRTSLS